MDLADEVVAIRKELREHIKLAMTVHDDARRLWVHRARTSLERLRVIATHAPGADVGDLAATEKEIDAAVVDGDGLGRFLKMRLEEQCSTLAIPLAILDLEKTSDGWLVDGVAYRKPEAAAFAHYGAAGWQGAACEGAAPLMIMKAAALNLLAAINTLKSREDACSRYFEAQCTIHADRHQQIHDEILHAADGDVESHLREITNAVRRGGIYPEMDVEGLVAVWRALQARGVANLAAAFMQDPYGLRAGWPDLTLARGTETMFVEVKTTDKLHNSQRTVISRLLLPLGQTVSVIQLRRRKI